VRISVVSKKCIQGILIVSAAGLSRILVVLDCLQRPETRTMDLLNCIDGRSTYEYLFFFSLKLCRLRKQSTTCLALVLSLLQLVTRQLK
jgi:hypothetical protein